MNKKRRSQVAPTTPEKQDVPTNITNVGDISGGKGFAIGPGAKAFVLEIGSLFNLGTILKFFSLYWPIILTSIVLQSLVTVLWLKYTNRFVIPIWILIVSMGLLEICILAVFGLKTHNKHRPSYAIFLTISILALTGLSASEYHRIMYPPKFQPDAFGVAIAQFGEGPEFKNTRHAREINQIVLQQLAKEVQENPDLRFIQFKPIGLVSSSEEASTDGSRIGADLVIWGQLQVSENQTILNFSILETPDKVSNPLYPRVLPLYKTAASSFIEIEGQGSEDITKGTTRISAFTFGLAHYFNWDFKSSAAAFKQALNASTSEKADNYHYLLNLYYGLSLQGLGQLEQANEIFQQAIEIRPEDPAPWLARAFGNRSLARLEEAQQDARIALSLCSNRIQLDPDDYVAYYDRGLANEILQDWDSALNDHITAEKKAPDLYIARISVVRMLIKLNRLSDALKESQEAIKLAEEKNGNPAWAYLYLAYVCQHMGNPAEARLNYEKAISLAPQVDYIHLKAGDFLASTGDPQDLPAAEDQYKTLITISSDKVWAYSVLADFYVKQNRIKEAISEYRAALQYDPKSALIWTGLAEAFTKQNQFNEARDAYSHAVEMSPTDFYAHYLYGNFLFSQGELEGAIIQWKMARQLNAQSCGLLLNIGKAYDFLGDQEQAKVYYHEAYSTIEQDSECRTEAAKFIGSPSP